MVEPNQELLVINQALQKELDATKEELYAVTIELKRTKMELMTAKVDTGLLKQKYEKQLLEFSKIGQPAIVALQRLALE